MADRITSLRIEPGVAELLKVLGLPHQRIFQRGLIAYGLEGKIQDPRVLALVKRRHAELIEELNTERLLMEELIRIMEGPHEPKQEDKPLERWELASIQRL